MGRIGVRGSPDPPDRGERGTMKRRLLWGGAVTLAVVAGAALLVAARGREGKGLEVQTAKVSRREIVHKVNATAKIQPKTQIKIRADVSAKIKRRAVVR